ncbi:MAG TPA: hypothetical protein DEG43_09975 [Acidimicrobiaceae bacterium]|jgi:colanic acid/amylovoran biosynthesis glycosyltransferase|nr:hypothetical protein [Acidimicrobiaceae bacterium]
MKITYVMTHHPRTAQTFITAEILGLRARGFTVDTIAMNSPDASQIRTAWDRQEQNSTLYLKNIDPRDIAYAVALIAAHPRAARAVSTMAHRSAAPERRAAMLRRIHFAEAVVVWAETVRSGSKHLHAHFGQTPSTIAWLAAELGRRTGVGARSWSFTVHGPSEVLDRHESCIPEKLSSADMVFAVCEYTRGAILRWSPDHSATVRIQRCGLPKEFLAAASEQVATLPVRKPNHVVAIGRLVEAKGFGVLIKSIGAARDAGTVITASIIGEGPERSSLESLIRELDLGAQVSILGERDSAGVIDALLSSTAYVHPSFDEGLPISIMEAMALRVPVVATAVGGVPELVVHDHTGILVAPRDVESLVAALIRICDPSHESCAAREEMVEAAVVRVKEFHGAGPLLDELAACFGALLEDEDVARR